jgi:hypothetical protein
VKTELTAEARALRDEADELGLIMLGHIVDPAYWTIELTSPLLLASEVITLVERTRPAAVCLGALPASGLAARTRYLSKRLRARFPDLRIIVGRWGLREEDETERRHLEVAGASYVFCASAKGEKPPWVSQTMASRCRALACSVIASIETSGSDLRAVLSLAAIVH